MGRIAVIILILSGISPVLAAGSAGPEPQGTQPSSRASVKPPQLVAKTARLAQERNQFYQEKQKQDLIQLDNEALDKSCSSTAGIS